MKKLNVNEPSTLNIISFVDGKVYVEVNTGNNRKPNFITPAGFESWAKDKLSRSPGCKLALVAVDNKYTFNVEQVDLPLIEAHKYRLEFLESFDKKLVVNSMGRLRTDLQKLYKVLADNSES